MGAEVKEGAKTRAIALVFLVLFAWALYVIMMASAAQAHTVAMDHIRGQIGAAVERRFSIRVIHHIHGCHRYSKHDGGCVIRLYTLPYRDKYCGVGWVRGGKAHVNLTPCPGPRGMPGQHVDGHPIPVMLPPPDHCKGRQAPKVCRYDDRLLRFPHPKPCPSWCQNTKRWV
jgi:hypothetical protein